MCGKMAKDGGHGGARRVYLSGRTGPPKPPPPSKIGLTEVERAISVLEGRHPDHEKVRRQTQEAVEQRRRELAIELDQNARRRRARAIGAAATAVAITVTAVVAWKVARRTRAIRAALDETEEPWLARGFTEVASNALTARRTLEADLPASSCFVGIETGDAPLRATVGGAPFEGSRSVAWCSCEPSRATIAAPAAPASVGLAMLRVDASVLGGPLARSWVDFTPGAWGDGGRECADATLDAWIAARRSPTPVLDEGWLDANPSRAPLRRAGFSVVGGVEASRAFGVVEASAGSCMLAVGAHDERLSLRALGGEAVVSRARGALAWCNSASTTWTVWREGSSSVVVLASSASRIGGLLGARECADEAGIALGLGATWLRESDLPWDAAALLRASTLSDVTTSAMGAEAGPADRRVVGLALSRSASARSEPETAVVSCDPPLGANDRVRESVCAHGAPVDWIRQKGSAAGLARGPLPFWLSSLEGRREADAVAHIPKLLSLARRLARDGFEPTRFEGVTELPDGVRISGRAGEDAVVAVGLVPRPPWAVPYSDGAPWTLEDSPRIVSLKAGDTVTLTSSGPRDDAPRERRTVVFRRAIGP